MKKKKEYDIILSIGVFLLFLSALFFRMSTKIDSSLEEFMHSYLETRERYENKKMSYGAYIDACELDKEVLDEFFKLKLEKGNCRSDYLQTIVRLQNDLDYLTDNNMNNDNLAIRDIKQLVFEHHSSFVLSIVCVSAGAILLISDAYIIIKKKKRL